VDWPGHSFLPQLIEAFPNAKIILTERDADSWYKSARKTISRAIRYSSNLYAPLHQTISNELSFNQPLHSNISDKDHVIDIYLSHVAWIKENIPSEKLICLNIADGWHSLCQALAKPIPKEPFPFATTTEDFRQNYIHF